jgi:hypothetical protein
MHEIFSRPTEISFVTQTFVVTDKLRNTKLTLDLITESYKSVTHKYLRIGLYAYGLPSQIKKWIKGIISRRNLVTNTVYLKFVHHVRLHCEHRSHCEDRGNSVTAKFSALVKYFHNGRTYQLIRHDCLINNSSEFLPQNHEIENLPADHGGHVV